MQKIHFLEETDVQAFIDRALGPWAQWSETVEKRLEELDDENKRQNRKVNALIDRVQALEEKLADPSSDDSGTYSTTY
jgi:uncharacterized protein YlxW (UPF0749 family)